MTSLKYCLDVNVNVALKIVDGSQKNLRFMSAVKALILRFDMRGVWMLLTNF